MSPPAQVPWAKAFRHRQDPPGLSPSSSLNISYLWGGVCPPYPSLGPPAPGPSHVNLQGGRQDDRKTAQDPHPRDPPTTLRDPPKTPRGRPKTPVWTSKNAAKVSQDPPGLSENQENIDNQCVSIFALLNIGLKPKNLNNPSTFLADHPTTGPTRPMKGPKYPKSTPRRPKTGPRGRPQDGPGTAPRRPRLPQDGPGTPQDKNNPQLLNFYTYP